MEPQIAKKMSPPRVVPVSHIAKEGRRDDCSRHFWLSSRLK